MVLKERHKKICLLPSYSRLAHYPGLLMLTTLIYRSHIRGDEPVKKIEEMVSIANRRNMRSDVTGILLFNGSHFFQLLEGPEEQVQMIYRAICQDPRHYNIVELLCDYAPARRFGKAGMELFDLRLHERDDVLQAVFDKGTSKFQLTYDDRALQFFRTFVLATEQSTYFEIPAEDSGFLSLTDLIKNLILVPFHQI